MTHSDLQWLRSEMERVIELGEKGTPRPWELTGPRTAEYVTEPFPEQTILGCAGTQQRAEANAKLAVAAVNYGAAWARHVLRVIERVEKCKRCEGNCVEPQPLYSSSCVECRQCKDLREDLSALIADMRKDGK